MPAVLSIELPLRKYNSNDTPDVREAAKDRHRPYWFGYLSNVSPERISTDSASGLGVYELADPAIAPNTTTVMYTTAGAFDHVWSYENLEAAEQKDSNRRIELALTTDYTSSASTAQITLVRNPLVVRIVAGENDRLDFTANSVSYTAEIAPGIKTIHQLKSDLETTMNLLAGSVYTWSFNESSGGSPLQKYSVAYSGSGSNVFLIATGANRDRSVLPTIGFTGDDDLTGSSLTADTAMPYDPDTNHIIRVDNYGYRDDASGTYTGTANGVIKLAPDIDKVLLVKIHNVSLEDISSSYTTARTDCDQEQSVYLGGLTSVQGGASFSMTHAAVRDRFARGCVAEIVSDSAGRHYFFARSTTVPDTAPHYQECDFLSFEWERPVEPVFGTVRVNFAQDPTTGLVQGRETTDDRTVLLHKRPHQVTFDTFLRYEADVVNTLAVMAALARDPIRHFMFEVVGRGAVMKPGDIVLLTRARALQGAAETGGLDADPFRVASVTKNPINGRTRYVVHTNILS